MDTATSIHGSSEQDLFVVTSHIQQQLNTLPHMIQALEKSVAMANDRLFFQAHAIEGLERTISAAVDRLMRRIDRVDARCGDRESKRFSSGGRAKYRD